MIDPTCTQKTIPYGCQTIDESDSQAVLSALKSTRLTQGPAIRGFGKALEEYLGVKHAIIVSNGTAALHLACLAAGVERGSVGITSPVTFAASANCILYCQGSVDFCDVDPMTGLMEVKALEERLAFFKEKNQKPGVIIPVSLQGRVGDLPKIAYLAKLYGWTVIEDAAQSFSAQYEHEGFRFRSASCSHSDMAILSFHPLKHITTGEGGAITTNSDALAERLRSLKSHGIHRPEMNLPTSESPWRYEQKDLGFNYRMTDVQAALGLSQISKAGTFLMKRHIIANEYCEALKRESFSQHIRFQPFDPNCSYHIFVIHFKTSAIRNRCHLFLKERGIETQVHHIPLYHFPYYRKILGEISLPGAESYYEGCLSLPIFPSLTASEQAYIISQLSDFCYDL